MRNKTQRHTLTKEMSHANTLESYLGVIVRNIDQARQDCTTTFHRLIYAQLLTLRDWTD